MTQVVVTCISCKHRTSPPISYFQHVHVLLSSNIDAKGKLKRVHSLAFPATSFLLLFIISFPSPLTVITFHFTISGIRFRRRGTGKRKI